MNNSGAKKAVFVFPSAAGHVNPSLPLCARLVDIGWSVEYLAIEQFKSAIESTGATFHDRNAVCAEFGFSDLTAMTYKTFDDYGTPGAKMWALNFGSIMVEKVLPVYISFLRAHAPNVVVYCPVLCQVAHFAALHLGIPDVSILTAAGPGYWDAAFASPAAGGATPAGLLSAVKACDPNTQAVKSICSQIGERAENFTLNTDAEKPVCCDYYTGVNIVTTTASLADTLNEKDAQYYEKAGQAFEFVGPLVFSLTSPSKQATMAPTLSDERVKTLFLRVGEAMAAGQRVVYVSLGTVLTSSQDKNNGWGGYASSSISGKELCHAVFRAVFALLGADASETVFAFAESPQPPLIVVSTGPEPDALAGLAIPSNAICLPSVPQVRLLQEVRAHGEATLAAVVTHGGQNSLMEALSVGAPVIGFGDQLANAARAESLGVGVKVDRPRKPTSEGVDSEKEKGEAAAAYEAAVANAIRQMMGPDHQGFLTKAKAASTELQEAGGVDKAAQIVLKAGTGGSSKT